MTSVSFLFPQRLLLGTVIVVPLFFTLRRITEVRRQIAALQLKGEHELHSSWNSWINMIFLVIAMLSFTAAVARPVYDLGEREIKRSTCNVVFLLDVSRSMLAEDIAPNRLERSKLAILDTLGILDGDRAALVVFGGTQVIKCPLTNDYGYFSYAVKSVSVNSVSRGGSLIGDAIRKVVDEIYSPSGETGDIILITDGDDMESFPLEAAKQAGEAGIRIIAIGLGDDSKGVPIPVTGEDGVTRNVEYQGEEVLTRLDSDMLKQLAANTPGGLFLNAGTSYFDLGDIYSDIKDGSKSSTVNQTIQEYEDLFYPLLVIGTVFIFLSILFNRYPVPGKIPFRRKQ